MIPLRDTQPSYSTPFVTVGIIVVNVMVFLYQVSLDPYELNHFIAHYAIVPDRFQYVDVLTAMFMHGGWMHLIGNMWFLWIYGDNIEDILGHGKYLRFICYADSLRGWFTWRCALLARADARRERRHRRRDGSVSDQSSRTPESSRSCRSSSSSPRWRSRRCSCCCTGSSSRSSAAWDLSAIPMCRRAASPGLPTWEDLSPACS